MCQALQPAGGKHLLSCLAHSRHSLKMSFMSFVAEVLRLSNPPLFPVPYLIASTRSATICLFPPTTNPLTNRPTNQPGRIYGRSLCFQFCGNRSDDAGDGDIDKSQHRLGGSHLLATFQAWSHFVLMTTSWGLRHCCLHCSDEETGAEQRENHFQSQTQYLDVAHVKSGLVFRAREIRKGRD